MKNESSFWNDFDKRMGTGCLGVIGVIVALTILIAFGFWTFLLLFGIVIVITVVVQKRKKQEGK